jgi:surfactin synthase thioesterase subunit
VSERSGRVLVRINTAGGTRAGVVCVPHAGAGAAAYMPLGKMLDLPGWAARFPGRESRMHEAPLPTIAAMADELAPAVRALDVAELVLFGHCCGALVAYDVALRLRDRPGLSLVVSACAAPGWPFDGMPSAADMSDEELTAQLAAAGGTDETLLRNKSFVEMVLPVYRADVLAVERYDHEPGRERLQIPVVVLAGKDDEDIPYAAFAAWARVTEGPFDIQLLDGGHFYLDQNERTVAGLLRRALPSGWGWST